VDWSAVQLPDPILPIRLGMTIATQKALVPSLASIALILACPDAIAGQSLSTRPASVALTVVVPPLAPPVGGVVTDGSATVLGRTSTAVDLETMVGLGDHLTSRIEVRLGAAWTTDSARVWVRSRNGTFEQLLSNTMIVALDAPLARSVVRSPLHFRVESARPLALPSLSIPVEYRLTVGTGDEIAVWTFPTVIRFDSTPPNVDFGSPSPSSR
jgi:hypothetical protein